MPVPDSMPVQIDEQWSILQAKSALDNAGGISVLTSGSTGNAKAITISRNALAFAAQTSNQRIGAKAGDIWSLLLPLSHIAGINVIARASALGTIPHDFRSNKNYSKVDFTAIVPTQLHRALTGDSALLAHLQGATKVLVGGAPLKNSERSAAENAGISIVSTYGMTESCGGSVYDGIPLAGVEFKVSEGVIYLRGPVLAEVELSDGWFQTSDRGRIENGKLIVEGRIDDQIITGGEKISLSLIESALKEKFNSEFVAFSRQDSEWGQRLCVAKVSDINDYEISSYLKARFGAHASPKEIVKVTAIPVTPIGKPDRKKLAEG